MHLSIQVGEGLSKKSMFDHLFLLVFMEGHFTKINKIISIFYFFLGSKIIKVYLTYSISQNHTNSMHLSSYVINILALPYS